jgi:hypothetical protein
MYKELFFVVNDSVRQYALTLNKNLYYCFSNDSVVIEQPILVLLKPSSQANYFSHNSSFLKVNSTECGCT